MPSDDKGPTGMMQAEPGALLAGRYRLAHPLGDSGTGAVWKATDTVLKRKVAVRILTTEPPPDPLAAERLREEARAVARLNHAGLVDVFDYREEDGGSYVVMQFLGGDSMAKILTREGRISASRAADVAAQAADALAAMHRERVVHRAVNPATIMVTDHGVKLLGFGFATTAVDVPPTATGIAAAFHSPERLADGRATPAGDLYSLGVVLYLMLTGRLPKGDDPLAHAVGAVREPGGFPDDVPVPLAELCRRLLAADPAARPAPAGVVADALRHAVPEAPPTPPEQAPTVVEARPTATPPPTIPVSATAGALLADGEDTARAVGKAPRRRSLRPASRPDHPIHMPARLRGRRALLGGAAAVVVAVVLAAILWATGSSGSGASAPTPAPAPSGTAAGPPPPPAPPATASPTSAQVALGIVATLRGQVVNGKGAGGITPRVAGALTSDLTTIQTEITDGHPDTADTHVILMAQQVSANEQVGLITPATAAALTTQLIQLATVLGAPPGSIPSIAVSATG